MLPLTGNAPVWGKKKKTPKISNRFYREKKKKKKKKKGDKEKSGMTVPFLPFNCAKKEGCALKKKKKKGTLL